MANAVKFTERGQVGLRIEAAPLARGKLRLSFTVFDSGIGISDAEIDRLFRPFAQASKEIAQRFGGSGLGLVQVRRLARSMHGDLTVESTPGRGSAFHLNVVLARARPPAAGAAADRALTKGGVAIPVSRTIPMAGQDERHRRRARPPRDLRRQRRGRLAALSAGGTDVVLMDVALPASTATRRRGASARCRRGRVAVIGSSGEGDAHQPDPAAAAAGMDACLTKPVSPRMLADVLARVRGETVAGA
jgi:CheY-like chemotaxis protein